MKITYDAETDALYIQFRPLAAGTAECRDLADGLVGDYDPDGKLAGLELLDASVLLGTESGRMVLEVTPALHA